MDPESGKKYFYNRKTGEHSALAPLALTALTRRRDLVDAARLPRGRQGRAVGTGHRLGRAHLLLQPHYAGDLLDAAVLSGHTWT